MRHYEVYGSISEPGKSWRKNMVCSVLADHLLKAVELAVEKHPGMEVFSVQHRGAIEVIQQDDTDRDALRYRWMRSEGLGHIKWEGFTTETCDVGLDYAIDQAIRS